MPGSRRPSDLAARVEELGSARRRSRRTCSASSSRRRGRALRRLPRAPRGDRPGRAQAAPPRLLRTPSAHLSSPEVLARAHGGAEARTEILAAIAEYSDKHDLYRRLLELGGDELKTRLLELLPRWRETVFASDGGRVAEAAERDAAAKRALAKQATPPEQLTELATRGYRYRRRRDPDARLLPQLVDAAVGDPPGAQGHEDLLLPDRRGEPEAEASSPAELARIYKALGDEGRLRLLRRLSEGPADARRGGRRSSASRSRPHITTWRSCGTPGSSRSATRTRRCTASAATWCRRRASCSPSTSARDPPRRARRARRPPSRRPAVGLALHAFADAARALGVPLRALVEAVDLELEPVVAALADQVPLQEAGGVVGRRAAAEVGMDGEPAQRGRSGCAGSSRSQAIAPARSPSSSTTSRPPSSGSRSTCSATSSRSYEPAGGEERPDVLVGVELGEEVDVVAGRAGGSSTLTCARSPARAAAAGRRRRRARRRRGSAPARRASPRVIASSRMSAP